MKVEFMIAQYNHPIRREQRIQGMASKIVAELRAARTMHANSKLIEIGFELATKFEAECQARMKKVQADALS